MADDQERAENPRADHTSDPRALAHAEMARAKARLCARKVRVDACKIHRNESEESA